jgi:hypothetical protein
MSVAHRTIVPAFARSCPGLGLTRFDGRVVVLEPGRGRDDRRPAAPVPEDLPRYSHRVTMSRDAPEVLAQMREDQVDAALLVPV